MELKETVGEIIDRIQAVSRIGRTPKPMIYIDMETRMMGIDPGSDVLCAAYKIGNGPVRLLPIEAAAERGDWDVVNRLHEKMFADMRRQHRSWLTRKFLTLAARARTIFKR